MFRTGRSRLSPQGLALTGLLLAASVAGCEQISSYFGTVSPDYRPAFPTGAIIGKVVDRAGLPVDGATVTDGANVAFSGLRPLVVNENGASASLAAGEYYLDKVPSGRVINLRASFDGIASPLVQIQIPPYDPTKATDAKNADPSKRNVPARLDLALVLPLDTPVDAADVLDSDGIFDAVKRAPLTTIQVATSSTGLNFTPSGEVLLALHRPPGASSSLTVRKVQITYLNESDQVLNDQQTGLSSNPFTRTLASPTSFLPGTAIKSGPTSLVTVPVTLNKPEFSTFLSSGFGLARVKIELLFSDTGFVKDRANNQRYQAFVDLRLQR
jgi:hypothetical protein